MKPERASRCDKGMMSLKIYLRGKAKPRLATCTSACLTKTQIWNTMAARLFPESRMHSGIKPGEFNYMVLVAA